METTRYVVGCLLVIGLPPGLAWWFVIHPFVGFWRRIGVRSTLAIVIVLALLMVLGLYRVRDALLGSDLGTSGVTITVAGILLCATTFIALQRRKLLTTRILAGAPELEKGGRGGTLITEGPYARCRNPRYVEVILGVFAYAFFSNYLGAYAVALLSVPVVHMIVLLEERELRDRFGAEYEAYLARVPRYLPRRRPAEAPGPGRGARARSAPPGS